jgi:Protein of unknown function (DUF2726)
MSTPQAVTSQHYLRRLQTRTEHQVGSALTKSVTRRREWQVHRAVKMTSVIDRAPSVTRADWNRATRQHLDFLVTDENRNPVFAVELDGATHRQAEMIALDQVKDRVCQAAGLDLL